MKKLGMGALLGVGQGSERESQLVVMQWNGARNKKEAPVAFVGKGVCFDSGGLSLKPAASMMGMKGDMGGAAAVTGTMHALAARKARVNAVGVIGLVENMPDGKAQRPDDVVKSMSGQTIEVLNTDAEGRLVLADALWYTQSRFKPKFIIDLATLTGAILVALGGEHAGMFSNDDKLSERISQAGREEGEAVWRLPLGDAYDKLLKSKIADMKNIGGPNAGSITAAQFLQRFVEQDAVGASRYRGRRLAGRRAETADPKLGHGLGRAHPQPALRGSLREVKTQSQSSTSPLWGGRRMKRSEMRRVGGRCRNRPHPAHFVRRPPHKGGGKSDRDSFLSSRNANLSTLCSPA